MNQKIMNQKLKSILFATCLSVPCNLTAQQMGNDAGKTAEKSSGENSRWATGLTIAAYTAASSPVKLSAADLKAMPHITVTFHNTHTSADETYSGVRVADILTNFKAPLGSELRGKALTNYMVATGSDGYQAVLALAEVDPAFHPGEVIVADTMDGKPLDEHNGPLKLVVTEDKRPARSVRNLVSVELKTLN
jgi:hypothetical protein